MNGRQLAIDGITKFMYSKEKGLLLTGTHQLKKHRLIMTLLEEYCQNAKILFRINALQNLTSYSFLGLRNPPRAGELMRLGHNYYQFDAMTNSGTWRKSGFGFNFAIVYPIDYLCKKPYLEPIDDIVNRTDKLFLCSWTDMVEYDFTVFSDYYTSHVVYDAEEEDIAYHKRVLKSIGGHLYE